MSALGQISRNTYREKSSQQHYQNTNEWKTRKPLDRIGYKDHYQSKTSFLDKYRPKTASCDSSFKDSNSR